MIAVAVSLILTNGLVHHKADVEVCFSAQTLLIFYRGVAASALSPQKGHTIHSCFQTGGVEDAHDPWDIL